MAAFQAFCRVLVQEVPLAQGARVLCFVDDECPRGITAQNPFYPSEASFLDDFVFQESLWVALSRINPFHLRCICLSLLKHLEIVSCIFPDQE